MTPESDCPETRCVLRTSRSRRSKIFYAYTCEDKLHVKYEGIHTTGNNGLDLGDGVKVRPCEGEHMRGQELKKQRQDKAPVDSVGVARGFG